jgi:hypothetical protein
LAQSLAQRETIKFNENAVLPLAIAEDHSIGPALTIAAQI